MADFLQRFLRFKRILGQIISIQSCIGTRRLSSAPRSHSPTGSALVCRSSSPRGLSRYVRAENNRQRRRGTGRATRNRKHIVAGTTGGDTETTRNPGPPLTRKGCHWLCRRKAAVLQRGSPALLNSDYRNVPPGHSAVSRRLFSLKLSALTRQSHALLVGALLQGRGC